MKGIYLWVSLGVNNNHNKLLELFADDGGGEARIQRGEKKSRPNHHSFEEGKGNGGFS